MVGWGGGGLVSFTFSISGCVQVSLDCPVGMNMPGTLSPPACQANCLWRGGRLGGRAVSPTWRVVRAGVRSLPVEGRAVLPETPAPPPDSEACGRGGGGGGVYGQTWGNRRSPAGPGGWGLLPLSSASCPQAEKHEDSVPPNSGELEVRAKLVLPAGPRKLQEAQEGRWPPAS